MPIIAGMRLSLYCGAALVAVSVALAPSTAFGQAGDANRIDAIERQIRSMEGQFRELKAELRRSRADAQSARQEVRQARDAAAQAVDAERRANEAASRAQKVVAVPSPAGAPQPPGPKIVQTAGNRFGFESADGRNSIYLTGRLHFDVNSYLDYEPDSRFATVQNLHSGVNARRARIGVTGKFAGDWNYSLIYDFGGSSDGLPPTPGAPASGIQSAYVTYNGFNKGPLPLAFDIGYMDTPFSLEQATSSNDVMFMERPSIQAVATGIFANDFRSAFGVRSNNDRYWAGIYLTGPQSGATHITAKPFGAFGRATYQVLQTPEYSLHLGGDVGALLEAPGSPASIALADRPELRLDPTTIIGTGALGTAANPVSGAQVYGVEAAAGWRNFFLQGEYYHIDVDRRGLGTNIFDGGYIEGSWTISGEQRKYVPATGAYSSIVPNRPFEPWMDNYGTGAWEIAARYSTINLNDRVAGPLAVAGGYQNVYAVGVNWYPNANMRFMFDFLHGDISKRFAAGAPSGGGITGTPSGTPIGGSFNAIAMRTQFAF